MRFTPSSLLRNDIVKVALRSAWRESSPGIAGGHEEGGFILQSSGGDILILRWPVGIQNDIAVTIANVLATANKRASEMGIDVAESLLTITQRLQDDIMYWRINYGPKDYINTRGGDLVVDVSSNSGEVEQVLWGQ